MMRICVLLIIAIHCVPLIAAPRHLPVPGGLVVMAISAAKRPILNFAGRRVMVIPGDTAGHWSALVGIPLTTSPGTYYLESSIQPNLSFVVGQKSYETQYLTISNKRQVNPEPTDLERIRRDRSEMDGVFTDFTEHIPDQIPVISFIPPARGIISSTFGLRRYYNNEPRNPHSGLDIAGPEGTPVHAPAPGRIAASGNYFFNGNTLLIDHGQGLVTMYCHLRDTHVEKGQVVSQGDLIGSIGQTGRVTGPHLHWSISLNNARIDPLLFIEDRYLDSDNSAIR